MSERLTNIARGLRELGDPELTNEVCEYIKQLEDDKLRMDRLEKAEWFVLETLPDGRKKLKILIHKDAACYLPEAGTMTVRELLDNEGKVFAVIKE